jgi:hypothetical protein
MKITWEIKDIEPGRIAVRLDGHRVMIARIPGTQADSFMLADLTAGTLVVYASKDGSFQASTAAETAEWLNANRAIPAEMEAAQVVYASTYVGAPTQHATIAVTKSASA